MNQEPATSRPPERIKGSRIRRWGTGRLLLCLAMLGGAGALATLITKQAHHWTRDRLPGQKSWGLGYVNLEALSDRKLYPSDEYYDDVIERCAADAGLDSFFQRILDRVVHESRSAPDVQYTLMVTERYMIQGWPFVSNDLYADVYAEAVYPNKKYIPMYFYVSHEGGTPIQRWGLIGNWLFYFVPALLLLKVGHYAAGKIWRRLTRWPVGHCQTCGYNLTGNVSGICPECGIPIPCPEGTITSGPVTSADPFPPAQGPKQGFETLPIRLEGRQDEEGERQGMDEAGDPDVGGYRAESSGRGRAKKVALIVAAAIAITLPMALLMAPKERMPEPEPPEPPRPPTPLEDASQFSPLLTLDLGGDVTMELVLIQPGTFTMGSPGNEKGRHENEEGPQHRVTISRPFYMGKYEVTQAQWQAIMDNNPSHFTRDANLPVEQVSWEDCREFCKRLSEKTGQTVRLPTEAEWEYACRAGTTTPFSFGVTLTTKQANYDGNYSLGNEPRGDRRRTAAVGSFPANAWGLHDMHGNVEEWCEDWYGPYNRSAQTDPRGASSAIRRVIRGGDLYKPPERCRSAYRVRSRPTRRWESYGLRCVVEAP